MSVAPGSSVGSFRVLYIALIYMSLEINLASTLPHHPPPSPPPLQSLPPSPSGLGVHLSFPCAPWRMWAVRVPHGSCQGGGDPACQLHVGLCHLARWQQEGTGGLTAAGVGRGMPGGALLGHGVPAQGSPRSGGPQLLAPGQREGMEEHLRDKHGLVFTVWKRRSKHQASATHLTLPQEPRHPPPSKMGVPQASTYCAACRCRHCRQWRRCAGVPRNVVCPCRQPPRARCRRAATCRG